MKNNKHYTISTYIKKDFDIFKSEDFKKIRKTILIKTRNYFINLVKREISIYKKI